MSHSSFELQLPLMIDGSYALTRKQGSEEMVCEHLHQGLMGSPLVSTQVLHTSEVAQNCSICIEDMATMRL